MTILYPCYEAIQPETVAELCGMFLCSCNVSISPWRLRRTIKPEKYEAIEVKKKLMKLAEADGIGLTKCGEALTIFSTRKSFVLFMVNQCDLLSETSRRIPDFIRYANDDIKKCFLHGLITRLYVDPNSEREGKSVETKFNSFANELNDLLLDMGIESFINFIKCDGKRVKHDKYVVVFYPSEIETLSN